MDEPIIKRNTHPADPTHPLQAAELIRAGELCYLGADGQVYRANPALPRPIDGISAALYQLDAWVTLYMNEPAILRPLVTKPPGVDS